MPNNLPNWDHAKFNWDHTCHLGREGVGEEGEGRSLGLANRGFSISSSSGVGEEGGVNGGERDGSDGSSSDWCKEEEEIREERDRTAQAKTGNN